MAQVQPLPIDGTDGNRELVRLNACQLWTIAGRFATLVALTNPEASLFTQLAGVASIGAFVFLASFLAWTLLRSLYGIRLHPEHETAGGDLSEVGLRAYNFG